MNATARLRNRNPCGDLRTFLRGARTDLCNVDEIDVPVLVVTGRDDALFPPPGGPEQVGLYTGTDDVSLSTIPNASHAITLERSAPDFRAAVRQWLEARDFTATR